MSSGVFAWSKTVATNSTADSGINLRDNQAPSVVKIDMRTIMAQIAKWRDDLNGSITTGGTATAYTITSNQGISGEGSVPDGFEIAAIIHADSGLSPTLAVDGLTAYPITYKTGFSPPAGMMEAKSGQRFRFVTADSEWRLMHVIARDSTKPGATFDYWGSSLPSGFVWANGTTIGNASSNATGRANADCAALFAVLWGGLANTEAVIYDSAGSTTTRGADAATDFGLNKAIAVPDRRDRGSIGKGTMGGTTAAGRVLNTAPVAIDTSTLGKSGGADRDTLDATKIPAHSHSVTDPGHGHTISGGLIFGGSSIPQTGGSLASSGSAAASAVTGISIQNTGGGLAHNNVHPVIVCNVVIKL